MPRIPRQPAVASINATAVRISSLFMAVISTRDSTNAPIQFGAKKLYITPNDVQTQRRLFFRNKIFFPQRITLKTCYIF